ncbi:MAG: M20/M25/M40 family metallo-hydrolase, partial [Nanoarchaeota archaeon]|nr:M20/M25/M40 family metallo-hydrolase [Nanoarchaeota archaeon]
MKDIVAELARRLVEIPSETGKEKEIGDMIAERLSQRFDIQKQKVKPKRFNILATKGTPNLIFNIHLDTVPGHIPIRIEDNHLWGRGSVDAKGPLAALIIAAEKASDQGITDFAIMLDVGEEVDLCGIKKLIPELDDANLIIVCEPTNMKLRVAQKGTAKIKIKTKGKAAHSAYPHLGIDANEKLLDALNTIRSLPLGNDKKLGPTTINVGVLKGGTAANVISDQAEAFLSIRITPGDEDIVDRIQDALKDQDGIE